MSECDVCCGLGDYPIINKFGQDIYHITCPQCFGKGEVNMEEDVEVEEPNMPPRSTAADIKDMAHLKRHVEENWR